MGFSVLMPILPFIVESYHAPKWMFGILLTLYSAFQFIGAPFLGSLSDSMGRKKILLLSQGGTLLSWIIFAIALGLPDFPVWGMAFPLIIIAISRALDGITGGNVSVTNAYISDVTTREEKGEIFGYLGGIAGMGMIVGPGIGGIAAGTSLGFLGTIIVSIIISTLTLIAIFVWLKESHPPEKRVKREKQSIWMILYIPGRIERVNPSRVIRTLFTVKFIFSSMMAFYIGTMALFVKDLFNFTAQELGGFLFIAGAFLAFNQVFLSKIFVRKIGAFPTLLTGLALAVIGLIALTVSDNFVIFVAFYYVLNLGLSLCFPTFNALISMHANPLKQGEIMGISEAINSFAMAIFPAVSAYLYSQVGFNLYFFISLLPALGFTIAIISYRRIGTKAFQ